LILGFGLATVLLLPGCKDQSERKDSQTQSQEKGEVEKKPPSDSPGDRKAGAPGKESKEETAAKGEKPAPTDPNEAKAEAGKRPEGKSDKPGDKDTKDKDKKKDESVEDPNDPLEAVNFKEFEIGKLMDKIGQWTGKAIVPVDGKVLKEKITICSTKKLPRSKALELIYLVLRTKGFIAEEQDGIIFLKPLKEAKFLSVPTIPADQPLAMIADKEMIVQKFFRLKEYPPAKMKEMIAPLVPEYGYVNADEASKSLIVIETVGNLQRIERYIQQLDVAEEEEMQRKIFEIHQGDPSEIAQLLKIIMSAGYPELERRTRYSQYSSYLGGSRSSGLQRSGGTGGPEPVIIPEPTRKWIVVKATPEDMAKIEEWITKLDRKQEVETDYTIISVEHADVDEIADQIEDMTARLPGSEVQPNVQVFALEQNSTLLVFGSPERRALVEKMVRELDIQPDKLETVHVQLEHTEPDQIKQYVEELFTAEQQVYRSTSYDWGYRENYYRPTSQSQQMRVISYPTLNMVSVIADPNRIGDIVEQIKEWDQPLKVDDVLPLIITLHNSDPVKMATLLSDLFSEERSRGRGYDIMDMIFGRRGRQTTQHEVVGPLYGKLTFEAVPDTKKIIVISQIPAAYKVIEELIEELDRQEMAELPMVVVLKYADPEDLCERLNALLNEAGTEATIRLSKRTLSDYGSGATSEGQSGEGSSGNANRQNVESGVYRPPWTRGQRRREEEQPISNIIGQVRFIPDYRSKAVLVLCPLEYKDSVRQMIEELDKPAKQVIIKAVIMEVQHEDMTSLGVQLSSNPGAFGAVGENSLLAGGQLDLFKGLYEGSSFSTTTGGTQRGSLTLSADFNITALVDFLVKNTNAKILNEPKVWAKDNEEATFFNGGTVPFITDSKSSAESTSFTQSYSEKEVGLTMRVRPKITPDKAVDMEVNLIVSQLQPGLVLGNIATQETNTTTHMIVNDGETIMLSGIIFQKDSKVERKFPLLGDIPLAGELFKHREIVQTNNELLLFITPYVVEEDRSGLAAEEMQQAREKLNKIKAEFNAWLEESHPAKG